MPLHDRPPDPINCLQLTNRILVLEQAVDSYRIENIRLQKYMETMQKIYDKIMFKSEFVQDKDVKVKVDNINQEDTSTTNISTDSFKKPTSEIQNIKSTPQNRNQQIHSITSNIKPKYECSKNPIEQNTKLQLTPYLDMVKYHPIKAQPSIKQTIAKQIKMKRSISFYGKKPVKQNKKFDLTHSLNIICYERINNKFMEQIMDIFGEFATIKIRPQTSNVINLHCNSNDNYILCKDMLDSVHNDLILKFFPSPAVFEHSLYALTHSTHIYSQHIDMIKSLIKHSVNNDNTILISQMYTNQSHGKYIIRVSYENEDVCEVIRKKLNLTNYKSVEQLRNETPTNVSECLFPPTFTNKEIIDGVTRVYERIKKDFNTNQCMITESKNKSNTTTFKLCKVVHSNIDEMNLFIDKKIVLNTKQNITDGTSYCFVPSIKQLDEIIERKQKQYPFLTNSKLPEVTNPMINPIQSNDNTSSTTNSVVTPTINTTTNLFETRLSNIETELRDFKKALADTMELIDKISHYINNSTNNSIMQDDEESKSSSSCTLSK
ncbi:predicted protein [Naegleria gruberi]|uniref:Predicted protein n=1 Tax=Naegleria gruberi TaxID=5762 RepID=D2W3Q9_NAEGR|nr:uncharacterized protein NAEGRDRAFT_60033 [Naegleria gruberi]EFC36307.1 predicted protein [Naegleria gruberi]|eukprot:XP_002669051.1 predicted protein [Naegleria gruberi strain NEG-M]